jgi:hypothetical protein
MENYMKIQHISHPLHEEHLLPECPLVRHDFNPGDKLQYRTFYATVIPFSTSHGYGLKKGPFVTVEWDPDRKKRPCVESSGTYSNHIFELAQR